MANGRITGVGWLAIGLALVGSLAGLVNETVSYRSTGLIDWGHVALVFGVPILMYAIVWSASARRG
jgi:hypothetical protein